MISSFPVTAGRSVLKGLEWSGLFTFLNRARHVYRYCFNGVYFLCKDFVKG